MCLQRGTDCNFKCSSVEFNRQPTDHNALCLQTPGLSGSVSPRPHEHFLQAPFFFSTRTALKCNGHWDFNLYVVLLGKQAQKLRTQAALSFYILTPRCRVLLEQLTGLQLVKKFPAFYGTRRFITAITSARHLSLSWARSIQSISPHPTSRKSILILSSHLRLGLPSDLFPSGYPAKYIDINFI